VWFGGSQKKKMPGVNHLFYLTNGLCLKKVLTKKFTTMKSEKQLREQLRKAGYTLKKSRVKHTNVNNLGGYMIINTWNNTIEAGSNYELSLEDVEKFLNEDE
jgi:hypothetical protein